MKRFYILIAIALIVLGILLYMDIVSDKGEAVVNEVEGEESISTKEVKRWYTKSQISEGKKVYKKYCISCHNVNGEGTSDWRVPLADKSYPPPPLNGTAHTWHHSLKVLRDTIRRGGIPLGGKMPGFEGDISEADELAVISYFQSFWSDEIYKAWQKRAGR